MKKVLDILEKNVQWFALALGALFVLWMAYTYVITPPVNVKIGQQELSPGKVDKYIENNVVTELTTKMNDPRSPTLSAPTYVKSFQDEMSYAGKPSGLALVTPTPMFPYGSVEPIKAGNLAIVKNQGRDNRVVEKIVEPPAVEMREFRVGNSSVSLEPPKDQKEQPNQPQRGPNVAGAAGNEGIGGAGAPGAGAGAPNPGGPEPAVPVMAENGVDKSWVTVKYALNTGALAKSFQDTKIPYADLYKTTILQIDLMRQEKLPNGQWGNDTTIKPLSIHQLQPLPPAKSMGKVYQQFLEWASTNIKQIVQPDFNTEIKGDVWAVPGETVTTQPVAVQQEPGKPFNPADWANATVEEMKKAGLTNEQLQQVAKYKADKKREEQKNKNKGRGGKGSPGGGGKGVGGPGGGGPGGAFGPGDGGRPPGPPRGGRGGGQEGPSDLPGYNPGPVPGGIDGAGPMGPGGNMPQAPAAASYPLPPGEFDPRQPLGNNQQLPNNEIVGWAHDDTVVPGHIYRYRIVYHIKSPVFNRIDVTKKPELAEVFDVKSKDGEWSKEIDVPSLTNFFVISATPGKSSASIEVFRRQEGELKGKKFEVNPGDVVGALDGESKVDFTTGWTMVDVKSDLRTSGDPYVILMDPDGNLHRRNMDRNNDEYKKAKQQVASAAGSPAFAGGPPPGPGAGAGAGTGASGGPGAPGGRDTGGH
jgi:hypothetical protein